MPYRPLSRRPVGNAFNVGVSITGKSGSDARTLRLRFGARMVAACKLFDGRTYLPEFGYGEDFPSLLLRLDAEEPACKLLQSKKSKSASIVANFGWLPYPTEIHEDADGNAWTLTPTTQKPVEVAATLISCEDKPAVRVELPLSWWERPGRASADEGPDLWQDVTGTAGAIIVGTRQPSPSRAGRTTVYPAIMAPAVPMPDAAKVETIENADETDKAPDEGPVDEDGMPEGGGRIKPEPTQATPAATSASPPHGEGPIGFDGTCREPVMHPTLYAQWAGCDPSVITKAIQRGAIPNACRDARGWIKTAAAEKYAIRGPNGRVIKFSREAPKLSAAEREQQAAAI